MIKDSSDRVQKYLNRLASAKGYHKECIHTFLTGDGEEISLRASDLKELLQFVGSSGDDTHKEMSTTKQPEALRLADTVELEAQLKESTCTAKKVDGRWLTVVYRDIQPGDEAHAIVDHPKASALSWSHALHDRDAAIATQAKQGGTV